MATAVSKRIDALEAKLMQSNDKSLVDCMNNKHKWKYELYFSKCAICSVVCKCDFNGSEINFRKGYYYQACIHCHRETLA